MIVARPGRGARDRADRVHPPARAARPRHHGRRSRPPPGGAAAATAGGRAVVVGAGKASAAMAAALEAAWPDTELAGAIAVPAGTRRDTQRIELLEAGHPVPDERSVAAAQRMHALVASLGADDLVVALVSGAAPPCSASPRPG
ncbi:MAG: DUF4147 domain-containing protein [Halofilum sp. (in: g-proteobacteria)]|nr:DUF4147 domain-containing protein [Halofilum sp. (in: g-proteobacteria)]